MDSFYSSSKKKYLWLANDMLLYYSNKIVQKSFLFCYKWDLKYHKEVKLQHLSQTHIYLSIHLIKCRFFRSKFIWKWKWKGKMNFIDVNFNHTEFYCACENSFISFSLQFFPQKLRFILKRRTFPPWFQSRIDKQKK